jgi:glucan phosphoethanolaminetransferase (alkaline phosphatase superfamily)
VYINAANKVIEDEVLENKKREHTDNFFEATLFLKIAITMNTIGILLMAIIVYGKFSTELEAVLQYVGIGLICASVLSAVIIIVFTQKTKFVASNFDEKVWQKLSDLVSTETQG